MDLVLEFDRVKYECMCGSWQPLSYLYYCTNCPKLRCSCCVFEEMDHSAYCSSCLENTSVPDQRIGYCSNCFLCPNCGITLSQRAASASGGHFLHCASCMWTTNDIGLQPRDKTSNWQPPTNPLDAKFTEITSFLKNLAISTTKPNTDFQIKRKTLSNLGTPTNNKYGLGKSIQSRSRQIHKFVEPQSTLPSTEVPGLDPIIFTEEVDPSSIRSLDQDLMLVGQYGITYPVRKPLTSRRQIRCPEHDLLLYRSEYNLLSTTPKNYYSPSHFCPEVKFSHKTEFSTTDEFSVFLSISNWTPSPLQVTIMPLPNIDFDCLKCLNDDPIELLILKKDGTATADELINLHASYDANEIGSVVFNQKHRIGIHFKCQANNETNEKNAHIILKICFHSEDKPEIIYEQRVKIFIHRQP